MAKNPKNVSFFFFYLSDCPRPPVCLSRCFPIKVFTRDAVRTGFTGPCNIPRRLFGDIFIRVLYTWYRTCRQYPSSRKIENPPPCRIARIVRRTGTCHSYTVPGRIIIIIHVCIYIITYYIVPCTIILYVPGQYSTDRGETDYRSVSSVKYVYGICGPRRDYIRDGYPCGARPRLDILPEDKKKFKKKKK